MATSCQIHSKLSLLVGVFTLRQTDSLVLDVLGVFIIHKRSETRLPQKNKDMSDLCWGWGPLKSDTFWSNMEQFLIFSFFSVNILFSDPRVSWDQLLISFFVNFFLAPSFMPDPSSMLERLQCTRKVTSTKRHRH